MINAAQRADRRSRSAVEAIAPFHALSFVNFLLQHLLEMV
jgi:hypothetical protein